MYDFLRLNIDLQLRFPPDVSGRLPFYDEISILLLLELKFV